MNPQVAIAKHIIEKFPGCNYNLTKHNGEPSRNPKNDLNSTDGWDLVTVVSIHASHFSFYVWPDNISITDWSAGTAPKFASNSFVPLAKNRWAFHFYDPTFLDVIDEILSTECTTNTNTSTT